MARSRLQYRALIAWLHLIQPVARGFGRMRGLLSPPDVEASAHVTTLPWTAPTPSVWSTAASARLQVGGTAEWAFWSEAWAAPSTVLTALVAALRASRPARRVDIDDGWHTDRDLSISVGRWGWLHVRALVEEHAEGRCLCRVAARLQPSVRGILRAVVISAVLVAASSAAIALRWPWVTMAAVASALALFVSAAWQTTRSVAVLDRALSRVTTQAGMVPLPGRAAGARLTWRPSTVLHKGQAALVVGVVAGGLLVSGLFLTRDLAPRARTTPARPRIITPAAPTAQRLTPRTVSPGQDLQRSSGRASEGVTPVGSARPRRDPPRTQLGSSPAPPPAAPRRVPRRTA